MVSKFKPAAPSLGCPNPEAAPASPQLTARLPPRGGTQVREPYDSGDTDNGSDRTSQHAHLNQS